MKTENGTNVVVYRDGFKGTVDIIHFLADSLLENADLEPEDRGKMLDMSHLVLAVGTNEPGEPMDPTLFAMVCLQVGMELLKLTPDYLLHSMMEKKCPSGSPLN